MVAGPASTLINLSVTFVGYPLYLKALGYEQYGVWLVLATVISFTQLSNLGLGTALMKLVAEERDKGGGAAIGAHTSSAVAVMLVTGATAAMGAAAMRWPIVRAFRLEGSEAASAARLIPAMATLSAMALVTQLYASVVSGLGRMDVANYVDSAGRLVGLLASIALVWRGWSLDGLAVGTALYYGFSQLVLAVALRRLGGSDILSLRYANWKSVKQLTAVGSGMFASSLLAMLLHPFNRFVMARWCGVGSIPIYEIAYSAAMQLRALAETGFRAMAPEISRLASKGRAGMERAREMVRRGQALSFAMGLPAWIAVGAIAPAAMRVWLGGRYDVLIPPAFRVIQVGTLLSLLCVPSYYALLGLGRSGKIFVANVVQSLGNVAVVGILVLMEWRVDAQAVSTAVSIGLGLGAAYVVLSARRAIMVSMAEVEEGGET